MPDAPKSTKSPRRWLTFSLRTMFIVVTLLCSWLGCESSVVRQRRAALQDLRNRPSIQITTARQSADNFPRGVPASPRASVSIVRRLLGDEAIYEIGISSHYQSLSEEDRNRLARIFPEARIHEIHYDNHLMEPCHPGCFPRGTLVDSPQERRLIVKTWMSGQADAVEPALPGHSRRPLGGAAQPLRGGGMIKLLSSQKRLCRLCRKP